MGSDYFCQWNILHSADNRNASLRQHYNRAHRGHLYFIKPKIMRKKKFIVYVFCSCFIALFFLCSFSSRSFSGFFPDSVQGDTSSFTANVNGGWSVLSSYLNQDTPDSVEFELILVQTNSRIQGSQERLVGTITKRSFLPQKNQKIDYMLLPGDTWYLSIKKNGECYLAQTNGLGIQPSNLSGNPDVIPIKVRYKNN